MLTSILSLVLINLFAASASETYTEGVRLYQEQRYVDAAEKFSNANQATPDNVNTLYNWGLSSYKIDNKGLALALWRRALFIDPEFSPVVDAIRFARTNMPDDVFKKSDDPIENLKSGLLRRLSLNKIFLLNTLLLLFSGWLLIKYFGKYKMAMEDDEPLPHFPTMGAFFSFLFILSLGLGGLKLITQNEIRATVITKSIDLRTGPAEDSNTVYSLLEGYEVIVENSQNDWTLVTYPGGMTGWIPKSALFISSGSRIW